MFCYIHSSCGSICHAQNQPYSKIVNFSIKDSISIYIHWPFCESKCPYCDFNSHVRDKIDHSEWEIAYLKELEYYCDNINGKKINSIFFGGGTPSLASPRVFESLLKNLPIDSDTEITMEANPSSVEAEKFKDFKSIGVNRVSIGIQSFNPENLQFLGRRHGAKEAYKAIELASAIFPRHSFDLIYALPNQTLDIWQRELEDAIKLAKDHLSLYQLTIEKGTKFFSLYKANAFQLPDENLSAEMYLLTNDLMAKAGLPYYEVSNYAAPGNECRHNLNYWFYGEYAGIGPGAHGRIHGKNITATQNIHSPEEWLKSVSSKGHGLQQEYKINANDVRDERLLMGLRTKYGINEDLIPNKQALQDLIASEHLSLSKKKVVATRNGMLLLNSLIAKLSSN